MTHLAFITSWCYHASLLHWLAQKYFLFIPQQMSRNNQRDLDYKLISKERIFWYIQLLLKKHSVIVSPLHHRGQFIPLLLFLPGIFASHLSSVYPKCCCEYLLCLTLITFHSPQAHPLAFGSVFKLPIVVTIQVYNICVITLYSPAVAVFFVFVVNPMPQSQVWHSHFA